MDLSYYMRKPFVVSIIELLRMGLEYNQIDDTELLLICVRSLRPHLRELDTYEAWILIKRKRWDDALRVLRALAHDRPQWSQGRALLAYCQFVLADADWERTANDVASSDPAPEAAEMVQLLMNISKGASLDEPAAAEISASASPSQQSFDLDYGRGMFMRT